MSKLGIKQPHHPAPSFTTMLPNKRFPLLLQAFCFLFFSYQFTYVLKSYINPGPDSLRTVLQDKNLSEANISLVFKVCYTLSYNLSILAAAGYTNVQNYFLGAVGTVLKHTIVGWKGKDNTLDISGKSFFFLLTITYSLFLGLLEDSKKLKTSLNLIKTIYINTANDTTIVIRSPNLDSVLRKTRVTKRNCFAFDFSLKTPDIFLKRVKFLFNENITGNVQVQIESSNLFSDRDLSVQSEYNTGQIMEKTLTNDNITGKGQTTYDVMLSKNIFVENDPTKRCRSYPSTKAKSYNECDKKFVRDELEKYVALDFIPIWATDNLFHVSRANVLNYSNLNIVTSLLDGSRSSNCPLPCETSSMRTRFFSEEYSEDAIIQINFANRVPVSKTDFVAFDISQCLSDIGGSLGLWLGVGVLQLLEVVSEGAGAMRGRYWPRSYTDAKVV